MLDGHNPLQRLAVCLCDDGLAWRFFHPPIKKGRPEGRPGSIFARQHNGEHPVRYRWISCIGRMRLQLEVIVVDLEEDPLSVNGERAKVMLAVGIIIAVERFELAHSIQNVPGEAKALIVNAQGKGNSPAPDAVAAEQVIEPPDCISAEIYMFVHYHLQSQRHVRRISGTPLDWRERTKERD